MPKNKSFMSKFLNSFTHNKKTKSLKKNKIKKQKNNSLKKNKGTLKLSQNIFGWRTEVRNKNFIKKVKKAYKDGYNKIIVDNYPDWDDTYNVNSLMKQINKNNTKKLLKY